MFMYIYIYIHLYVPIYYKYKADFKYWQIVYNNIMVNTF